jgi:hypothetical protein
MVARRVDARDRRDRPRARGGRRRAWSSRPPRAPRGPARQGRVARFESFLPHVGAGVSAVREGRRGLARRSGDLRCRCRSSIGGRVSGRRRGPRCAASSTTTPPSAIDVRRRPAPSPSGCAPARTSSPHPREAPSAARAAHRREREAVQRHEPGALRLLQIPANRSPSRSGTSRRFAPRGPRAPPSGSCAPAPGRP